MKFYFYAIICIVFNLSAVAGIFSSDFKLENDPNCFLDLKKYAGTFTEANFNSSFKGLGVSGPIVAIEKGQKRVTIPERHVFNCVFHKKDPSVRLCEGGDEVVVKGGGTLLSGLSIVYKVNIIRPEGKNFIMYTKDGKKINVDDIEKVINNFKCQDRQKYSDIIYGSFIRAYYNDMYIGDMKGR